MSNLSVGLNCPTCGGAITVMDGDRSINCRYCGSTLYVEGDQGVSTIAFKNNITRDVATNAVKEWWKKGFKARDLRHVGTITEIYPIYLPFWSIGTRVAGWVCGYEERTYTDSKGHTRTEREYKEEMVLQDVTFSEIACDPGDLGLRSMNNFDGKASFEDLDMIPTFESTTSRDDAVEHARFDSMARGRASTNIPNITFERLHVLVRKMSMIYYPVWVIRYDYQQRMYICTVDGVTGQVLSGRAPGDPLFQSLAVTAGTSVGGIAAAGGIIALAEFGTELGIAGIIFGILALGATYWFFRHGSEIVQGDFPDKKKMPGIRDMQDVGKLIQEAYR
ncbi:MAG: hypothetical protein GX307_03450 [Euryarchaeota archaeon]|nr:hypothetical protein [Euryarchaeota archaeon]